MIATMTGWVERMTRIVRSFVRRPAFPSLVVGALGLGMAVSLAAVGIAKQVLLDPLPYEDADRVMVVHRGSGGSEQGGITWGALGDLRDSGIFPELAAVSLPRFDNAIVLDDGPHPQRLAGLYVTPDFFRVLGVRPLHGRGFTGPAEVGTEVLLSHEAWQTRYGGRSVVGETMRINGQPRAVAGVLPPDVAFGLAPDAEVFLSFRPTRALATNRDAAVILGVARAEATGAGLERRLERADRDIVAAAPAIELPTLRALPIREFFYGDLTRPLLFLAVAGGLTLLVAVVNVALLVLARVERRRGEHSVRVALGASFGSLVSEPLSEALLLSLAATGVGVVGASGLVTGLGALEPRALPLGEGLVVDPVLLALALGLAGLVAGLVTILPVLHLRRIDVAALRDRTSSLSSSELRRWNGLVGAQTAMITLLLVAAALTGRSLVALLDVDPGFDTRAAYAVEFTLPEDEYGALPQVSRYLTQLEERATSDARIAEAGVATNLPLTAGWGGQLAVRDRVQPDEAGTPVDWEMVSPGYFDAMRIPLLRGRAFQRTDDPDAPRVAVVNETLAREQWPDGDAVGEQVSGTGADGPWTEIVGVVEDVHQDGLAQGVEPMMYVSASQWFPPSVWKLVVRAQGSEADGAPAAATAALRDLEPRVVVGSVRPLSELIRADAAPTRIQSALLGLFGATALLLGLAGIFGVVSYAVERRRSEIGIRMAMGADRERVVSRVLRSGLVPVAAGLAVGVGGALLASSYFENILFGVSATDPLTYLGLPPLLLAAAAAALLVPALRAARVDPARVLAEE